MVEVGTVSHLRLSRYSECEQDIIASCPRGPTGWAGRRMSTWGVSSQAGWGLAVARRVDGWGWTWRTPHRAHLAAGRRGDAAWPFSH
jgi:hypothetical protein